MQCCKCPGHRIGSLSYRTRRNILHSQTDLLDAFLINDNGLILPECYVDILSVETVENLFRSPARLMYALSRNENLEMELTGDILRKRMPDNFGCWADTGLCRTHDVKIEAPVHLAKLHIWLSTSCKRYRTFDPFQTGQMCSTPSQYIDYQSLSFTYCTAVSKKFTAVRNVGGIYTSRHKRNRVSR